MDHRSRSLEKRVAWVVAHPARARAWGETGRISAMAMGITLALGLAVHVLGFAVGEGWVAIPDLLPIDLTSTLISNLGIVLWTSVVLVVFLDVLPDRARRNAERSMAIAAETLREKGQPVPWQLQDADDVGSRHEATLAAVLERLDRIERLIAERRATEIE